MDRSELLEDAHVQTSIAFLEDLFAGIAPRDFAVRIWNGATWKPDPEQPTRFTIVLKHAGSVRNMFWPPRLLCVGEAYVYDEIDIEGDLQAFLDFCERLEDCSLTWSLVQKLKFGWRLWRMPSADRIHVGRQVARLGGAIHSRERDRQAIAFHYDVSNEFFAQFLGDQMMYTCGIFADAREGLDAAQERKLDLICRKLRLKPGDRLLDIGCGWGGLVMHAAKHYGAFAVGVTISQRQAEWATHKIHEAGLNSRCRIDLTDYRDIDEREPFDKIATVEVIEHFGADNLLGYFQKCWRLLRPQGSLLVQVITLNDPSALRPATREFGQAYIFPDGELISASFTQAQAERAGFEIRDLESLREHYALTLHHWRTNLEVNHAAAVQAADEATYRMFRLYFAGGARMGIFNPQYNVYQILFVKAHPYASGYPLSRTDWYAGNGVA